MVKKVRFTEPKDTSLEGMTGGDDMMFTCRGWYRHGCEKLMLRWDELGSIFPGRPYISGMDIVEHVLHVDPKVCSIFDVALRGLIRTLEMTEGAILEGKWVNGTTISSVTSATVRRMLGMVHNIDEMQKLVVYMMDDLYRAYIARHNPDAFLPAPTAPIVPLPSSSAKVTDKNAVKEMISSVLPYLVVLESYHLQIANLALRTSEAIERAGRPTGPGF